MRSNSFPNARYFSAYSKYIFEDLRNLDLVFAVVITGLAISIGGAYDGWPISHLILQAIAIVYCVFALFSGDVISRVSWPVRMLILGALALPIVQMIPMPSAIIDELPGRELPSSMFKLAGLEDSWRPISLQPMATLSSFVSLWPAVAVFLAVSRLTYVQKIRLLIWVNVFIMASMVLASAQFLLQVEALKLHDIDYGRRGMGFFRNYNHMAVMIVAWMPIATFLISRLQIVLNLRLLIATTALGIMFAIILSTTSRAGLVLATLTIIAIATFYVGQRFKRVTVIVPLTFAIGAFTIWLMGANGQLSVVLSRFSEDAIASDLRWPIIKQTLQLTHAFWPVGSGGGSFETVYAVFEPLPLLSESEINKAHNDYVQIAMEYGILGCALIMCTLFWFGRKCFQISKSDNDLRVLALASATALIVFLLHCLIDYPLRTPTCMTLFALFFAIMSAVGTASVKPASL